MAKYMGHVRPGTNARSLRRILLVAPTAPSDTSYGAAQRTAVLYRALQEHASVDALVVREGTEFAVDEGDATTIARLTVRSAAWHSKYRTDPDIARWAKANIDTAAYDMVVARELSTGGRLRAVIGAPLVVDADDANYRYAPSDRSPRARAAALLKTRARAYATRRALRSFAHVWFASPREFRRFPNLASSLLPNVAPDVERQAPPSDAARVILFVGSLWYAPNVDAVNWFVANCWPVIVRSVPGARLRIIGACAGDQQAAWNRIEGVECPGFIADLAAEYRAARFTIAPIRFGGGTQIKVLESCAYGRAAVVSTFVSGGYGGAFVPDESIVVADAPDEMVRACTALLREPEKAASIADAGHRVTLQRFNRRVFRNAVVEGLARVVTSK